MADLGIARMGKDADLGGTLTRADLADVVHNRLGLSRAESAQLVERVLEGSNDIAFCFSRGQRDHRLVRREFARERLILIGRWSRK